jgi:ubiquinone/menaquinone biosynthesis C-methylase UbiE
MAPSEAKDYDQGASPYAAHRQVHDGIFRELCRPAQLGPHSKVLEVGCGTGNYIRALVARAGCGGYGLEPSKGMLAQAQGHSERVAWTLGRAEELGFAPNTFALVFSVDVIHHVMDRNRFFHRAAQVLQPGGWLCTATDSEDVIRKREILSGYFPQTVAPELVRYPRISQLENWMAIAGLEVTETTTVEAAYELTSAQPYRDKAYSALHLISEEAWRTGLKRLEEDLTQGPVRGKSRYVCIWGRKW